MFARMIESEIEWCKRNDGAMPEEFRKGFIAGLEQAVHLINATIQRMEWLDGEIVDDDDLLERAAEQRDEADGELAGESPKSLRTEDSVSCPRCAGTGEYHRFGFMPRKCALCNGSGQIARNE